MDLINSIDELVEHFESTGYEVDEIEMEQKEDWQCSICAGDLKNWDDIYTYDCGFGHESYICISCFETGIKVMKENNGK